MRYYPGFDAETQRLYEIPEELRAPEHGLFRDALPLAFEAGTRLGRLQGLAAALDYASSAEDLDKAIDAIDEAEREARSETLKDEQ